MMTLEIKALLFVGILLLFVTFILFLFVYKYSILLTEIREENKLLEQDMDALLVDLQKLTDHIKDSNNMVPSIVETNDVFLRQIANTIRESSQTAFTQVFTVNNVALAAVGIMLFGITTIFLAYIKKKDLQELLARITNKFSIDELNVDIITPPPSIVTERSVTYEVFQSLLSDIYALRGAIPRHRSILVGDMPSTLLLQKLELKLLVLKEVLLEDRTIKFVGMAADVNFLFAIGDSIDKINNKIVSLDIKLDKIADAVSLLNEATRNVDLNIIAGII